MKPYLSAMNAILTEDGKISLPSDVRENAHLHAGDTLDVQFYKGTILLRKHQPLTPEQCAALLERSRSQPEPTADDDAVVAEAIREVRAARQ
jgi:bifunctional DNA-binding transcriptional regulator/antitoxin component of YhaV-PrlF toxin-antitoxin module